MAEASTPPTALHFSTVDVFTTQRYAGNPLAIVHVPKSVRLNQEKRQKITKEFNLSESVFVGDVEQDEAGPLWKVNIHTVTTEISFAGHPTIGTACHLMSSFVAEKKLDASPIEATLIVPAGRISIKYLPDKNTASAKIPHDYHQHSASMPGSALKALQSKLHSPPDQSPIASIVKGMTFILIKLESLEELAKVELQSSMPNLSLDEEWAAGGPVGAYYYVLEDTQDGSICLRTRMMDFEVALEDPATGSAATTLAAYIALAEGRPGQTIGFQITQGVEMGRASDIGVEVALAANGGLQEVMLSGSAVHVMKGELVAP